MNTMAVKYCELAKQVYNEDMICGSKCPAKKNCPKLILEDADIDYGDIIERNRNKSLNKAILAMSEMLKKAGKLQDG